MFIRVSDIKNYLYCPRVIYFTYNYPVPRKITYKMKLGSNEEKTVTKLERNRKLAKFGLVDGKKMFHYGLTSENLGLTGKLDMLIESGDTYYPVDCKYSSGIVYKSYIYQLGGYAVLLEDMFNKEVSKGFIYFIKQNKIVDVDLTANIKSDTMVLIELIRKIINLDFLPEITAGMEKCIDCDFKKYCSDVY